MATINSNTTTASTLQTNISVSINSHESEGEIVPKIFFGLFASISIIGNLLVCCVFLRNRQLLRLASSIFIFSLAIVDIITGIIILATPTLLYNHIHLNVEDINGEIYCALVRSEYFLWTCGIASCYIIVALSIERLCMVSAPTKYKVIFTPGKTVLYVFIAIIWGAILIAPNIYQYYMNENSTDVVECQFRRLPNTELNHAIYFTAFTLRFALPLVVMVSCYIAFLRKISQTVSGISNAVDMKTSSRNRMMLKRLTRMSILISIAFCVCWMPNQVYFALVVQDLVEYNVTVHIVTKILVTFNSAINPIIYASSNKYFCNELFRIIEIIVCCQTPEKSKLFTSVDKRTRSM